MTVLRELACLELEYSWKRGRPLRMQDFAAYPSLFNDPESLQALAFEEYRLRLQGGEQPTRAEYEERYGVQTASWPVADSGAAACLPPDKQQPRPTSPSAAGPTGEVEQAARAFQNFLQRNRGKETDVVSWRESFRGSRASAELFCQLHETDPKAAARLAQAVTNMPEVGEEICGFRLVGELGQGAFAKVFLARQVELGNRLVVLKVSGEGGGESQLLAQLQHTNIVPIHSQHRAGIFHVACMPFFGATTLADVLRTFQHQPSLPASGAGLVGTLNELISTRVSQRQESQAGSQKSELRSQETGIKDEIRTRESPISALPPGPAAVDALPELPLSGPQSNIIRDHLKKLSYVDAVLWMVSRLAYGLAHAHEHGILHRDLKPANILLTDEGQPMLLDFNLAEDTKLRNTASAALLGGTLPYMSPEQLEAFQGAKNVLDGRSDIYALGVILYELLSGRLPFETPRGPMVDVLDKMIEARHALLPRVPASHNGVTPAIDSIVRRCLEADPAKRYQTARQLQEDLQRQLANLPLKYAPEPSRRDRFRKWSRRHPRLSSLATLGTVALVMLLALSFSFWLR